MIRGILHKKIYIHFVYVVVFVLSVFFAVSYTFGWSSFDWRGMVIMALTVFVLSLAVYYADLVAPFNTVLDQVRAVLSNRRYKKIYSNRTDELGIFGHFFNEVTSSLEKVTEDLAESRKVTGELQVAGQLQKELIPIQASSIDGFDIAVKNRSAEELGGDNLDFIKNGSSTYFYVGDVTGHGVPAAIVMTMVNTLINAFTEVYDTAYDVVVQTNRRLKMRIRTTMFMSMLMLKWNAMTKKMTYVGCGHEYLVVYKAKTGVVEATISGGIALGMLPDNSKIVKEKDLPLDVGDVIVLYTDGVTEARNMKGELFGLERLKTLVGQYGGLEDSQTIIQNIANDFTKFVEEHVQDDDVTLIVVKKLAEGETGKSNIDQKQEKWVVDQSEEKK